MSWKDLGDLLHDLSYKAYRITNFVLLQEYLYAMKEEHNPEYLNDKGKLYLYPAITRTYPELSSHVVNGISQNASKLFRTHAKGIFRGDETLPTMKRNAPISFHNKGYTLTREPVIYNGKPQELFVANVSLYRTKYAKAKVSQAVTAWSWQITGGTAVPGPPGPHGRQDAPPWRR